MTADELQQKAIAHELFCELSPQSKNIAIGIFYGYCWSRKRTLFDDPLRRR